MPVIVDNSAWPVSRIQVLGSLSREEDDRLVQASTTDPLDRGGAFGLLMDLTQARTPSSRFVRAQAAANREHREELVLHCRGVAFISSSAMIRGAVAAVLHLQRLPWATQNFKDEEAAMQWLQTKLSGRV